MPDEPRRVRTQAERDADGTTWRAAAQSRPGYATYPTTPPGNPSWWRGQPPTPVTAADGGSQPGDHDRCAKWCGFCHLNNGEPEQQQPAQVEQPPRPDIDLSWVTTEPIRPPRRRWWHRYTRRTV